MDFENMADKEVLDELGSRIRRNRLADNVPQKVLANKAGVGIIVVQKIESGEIYTIMSMIRIMRALGLINQLDQFLPDPGPSPLQLVKLRGNQRQRASSNKRKKVI